MMDTVRELSRRLQLAELIISNFVPDSARASIEQRAQWDDETEEWRLPRLNLAGNHVAHAQANQHARRATTLHAKVAAIVSKEERFRRENVLALGLEEGDRTTQGYDQLGAAAREALDAALGSAAGDDLSLDAGEALPFLSYSKKSGGRKKGAKGMDEAQRTDDYEDVLHFSGKGEDPYPRSRGLVR